MRLKIVKLASPLLALCAVTVLLGCSGSASPVEILAQAPATPASPDLQPAAALATSDAELADAWTHFGFYGEPDVSLDDGPVLFVGTVESGSCPATVEYVGGTVRNFV